MSSVASIGNAGRVIDLKYVPKWGLFHFSEKKRFKQEMPDGLICDDGIALAIAVEKISSDGVAQWISFLIQMIKAKNSEEEISAW